MTTEVIEAWMAFCPDCGWESDYWDYRPDVERQASKHDRECPEAKDEEDLTDPREEWLTRMDDIVEQVRKETR